MTSRDCASALVLLIQDPELRRRLSAEARRAVAPYDCREKARAVARIYREVALRR